MEKEAKGGVYSKLLPTLVEELDAVFAQRAMADWAAAFAANNVWWAPVNSINEVVKDYSR